MKTSEQLRDAKARIENPNNWTTGLNARIEQAGQGTSPLSEEATCWCAVGSLMLTMGDTDLKSLANDSTWRLLRESSDDLFRAAVWEVNDFHGHTLVMQIYDEAIQRAGDEEIRSAIQRAGDEEIRSAIQRAGDEEIRSAIQRAGDE